MKHLGINLIVLAIVVLTACGQQNEEGFESTDSGLQYKYITQGEGEKAEDGKIVSINMMWKTADDSIRFPAPGQEPLTLIKIDSTNTGLIYEGFAMLKEGDSVEFKLPAKDFFENTARAPMPPDIDSTSLLTFNIGVDDVMSEEEFDAFRTEQMRKQREEMLAGQAEQMKIDSAMIEEYLKENNIDAKTTESGIRYVITKKGKGVQPSPGDSVFVQYTGKFLDGTKFDSSYDREGQKPLAFPIGQGMVIPGWDEGIALLNEGSKATLYVPSPLAYGPQGAGGVIEPNSVLVFDVELVDVKEANN